ncbi:MAG: pseudouridine synthase [Bacteroidota bacterium]
MVPRYFIVNKPYDMLSQFVCAKGGELLGSLDFNFPEGIHAVGRLDKQSEGLLILTTNKKITRLLFQGDILHKRTYLVKVKNKVSEESLQQLRTGIKIRVKGGENYTTTACEASIVQKPAGLFQQVNPLPDFAPHTWLRITLTEGKYHQIRKMVRIIHHRCQRLIRFSIEDLALEDLAPGQVREIEETAFFRLLKINNPSLSVATAAL